jgi:nucleoside-diphosphate-sugar epimerase
MKVLIIGGNRYVGLRASIALDAREDVELHVLNRTGQVAHTRNAVVHKGSRQSLESAHLDRDWDVVIDFAAFNHLDAQTSVDFFKHVRRYVFISTASVYDPGGDRKEETFEPKMWPVETQPTDAQKQSYQFGKRQAEAVFAQQDKFPVSMVRFPFIVGPDDYTRRLIFHIERVQNGQPIYFPNPKAKISMVSADDATDFLLRSLTQTFTGPINVASPDPIALDGMMKLIEQATHKKAILMKKESDSNHSPYGVDQDMTMNVERLLSRGYKITPLKTWLPELIAFHTQDAPDAAGGKLH